MNYIYTFMCICVNLRWQRELFSRFYRRSRSGGVGSYEYKNDKISFFTSWGFFSGSTMGFLETRKWLDNSDDFFCAIFIYVFVNWTSVSWIRIIVCKYFVIRRRRLWNYRHVLRVLRQRGRRSVNVVVLKVWVKFNLTKTRLGVSECHEDWHWTFFSSLILIWMHLFVSASDEVMVLLMIVSFDLFWFVFWRRMGQIKLDILFDFRKKKQRNYFITFIYFIFDKKV